MLGFIIFGLAVFSALMNEFLVLQLWARGSKFEFSKVSDNNQKSKCGIKNYTCNECATKVINNNNTRRSVYGQQPDIQEQEQEQQEQEQEQQQVQRCVL